MTITLKFLIFYYCLLTEITLASRRVCYRCLVQEKCLRLDKDAENATRECPKDVEHCVISRTKSKVTGAEAVDYMCGGRVYDGIKSSIKDGCFESVEDPGARTKQTVCYCSTDLCNKVSKPSVPLLQISLISIALVFSFFRF